MTSSREVVWADFNPQPVRWFDEFNHDERLWRAVLCQLLKDASAHHRRVTKRPYPLPPQPEREEMESAYHDVVNVGPMLRHICKQLDLAPLVVSDGFLTYCGIDP